MHCVSTVIIAFIKLSQALWLSNQDESDLFLSVLTFGEIEKDIEKAPDKVRKKKLKLWVEEDLKVELFDPWK